MNLRALLLAATLLPGGIIAQDDLDALARRAREQAAQPAKPKDDRRESTERPAATRAMKPGTARGTFIESAQLRSYANRRVPPNTWITGQFTYLHQKEEGRWLFKTTAMIFFQGKTKVLVAFPHGKQANLNHEGLVILADRNQPFKVERVVDKSGILTVYATYPFAPES